MWIVVAFGAGLGAGLAAFAAGGAWYAAAPVLAAAALLWRRAPLGAAIGVVGVAGILWGRAAVLERNATCAGAWGRGAWGVTRAATVRLRDAVGTVGGIVESDVVGGLCRGRLRVRWLESRPARGGTLWVVAGRWAGDARRGVVVARLLRLLDTEPRGPGALRGRLAERTAALFGSRATIVSALVFAPGADLDPDVRERYARSGLAHILSISGLHVGFLAAWLALILRKLGLSPGPRAGAAALLIVGYLWLLGFPAPATRAAVMLVADQVAPLRQRGAAPRARGRAPASAVRAPARGAPARSPAAGCARSRGGRRRSSGRGWAARCGGGGTRPAGRGWAGPAAPSSGRLSAGLPSSIRRST